MSPRPIRGLTLHSPWWLAITDYGKRVENRSWDPPRWMLGAFLAIHAGKTVDRRAVEDLAEEFDAPHLLTRRWPTGAVVAVATLERVARTGAELPAEQALTWWNGEDLAWVLSNVVPIEPVACPGRQGLWELPPDVLSLVRERYMAAELLRRNAALRCERTSFGQPPGR